MLRRNRVQPLRMSSVARGAEGGGGVGCSRTVFSLGVLAAVSLSLTFYIVDLIENIFL